MSRRLFPGWLADEIAGEDRSRAGRLRRLARELVGVVRDGLVRDGQVRVHGFGTFRLSPTRARRGINPQTGEPVDIPARYRVLFRPAKALRERIEPGRPAAVPLAEPHASREASLGGIMSETPAAGALPTSDEGGYRPAYFPDRIAAAAISDTVMRTREDPSATGSGSREANLGGTMGESPSAGRVPMISAAPEDDDVSAPFAPTTARKPAANEEHGRGSREASLGSDVPSSMFSRTAGTLPPKDPAPEEQEPERPATVPATHHGPGPVDSRADEAGVALPAGASREASLSGEAAAAPAGGLPAEEEEGGDAVSGFEAGAPLREDAAGRAPDTVRAGSDEAALQRPVRRIVIDDDVESGRVPEPETDASRVGRSRGLLLALLLLALLLAVLAWWLWPSSPPTTTTTATDTGVAGESEPTEPAATDEGASEEIATIATPAVDADAALAAGAVDEGRAVADEQGEAAVEAPLVEDEAATIPAEEAAETVEDAAGGAVSSADEPAAGEGIAGAIEESVPPDETVDVEAAMATSSATTESAAAAEAGTPWFSGRSYAVQRDDTLWELSDQYYVNPYYWPHIWNHNESLSHPDRIEIDQDLWLPALQGEPRSLTAADRRSIAEGYLRLYHLWRDTGAANPQYALVGVRYFDPGVMPSELRDDPAAGRPNDTLAAAFEAQLQAAFPRR